MAHLYLLFYFISLCFGLFTLGLLTLLYIKNRDFLLSYFLFFFAIFTLLVIMTLISRYYTFNIHNNPLFVIFILKDICPYIIIFTGIVILHEIFDVKFYKFINIIFIIILSLSFLFELIEDLLLTYNLDSFITNYFDEGIFIITITYILLIIVFYRKKIKRIEFKKFLKVIIIAFSITLLLFILDTLEDAIKIDFPLGSIQYLVWNLFLIYLIIKYYSNVILNKVEPSKGFINKYKISKREIEIINQLLKGHSYKKISDETFISLSTVKSHVSNIYKKIGIKSRHELFSILQETE